MSVFVASRDKQRQAKQTETTTAAETVQFFLFFPKVSVGMRGVVQGVNRWGG